MVHDILVAVIYKVSLILEDLILWEVMLPNYKFSNVKNIKISI